MKNIIVSPMRTCYMDLYECTFMMTFSKAAILVKIPSNTWGLCCHIGNFFEWLQNVFMS